ncbi:hypothetical protein CDD80_2088 [Ophiocordyceps camponoti-rufipedis]|uniref:Uncharacterized protein n=1 Tax=Ophiocordyceps camponoti-rufipedis TaxID=2004952 RepID=A0A2C5ZMP0_9HYPO|nr:hypothetical protein CDD80_2088 [Ophiocordyceps camponoti-rufipedis]
MSCLERECYRRLHSLAGFPRLEGHGHYGRTAQIYEFNNKPVHIEPLPKRFFFRGRVEFCEISIPSCSKRDATRNQPSHEPSKYHT